MQTHVNRTCPFNCSPASLGGEFFLTDSHRTINKGMLLTDKDEKHVDDNWVEPTECQRQLEN